MGKVLLGVALFTLFVYFVSWTIERRLAASRNGSNGGLGNSPGKAGPRRRPAKPQTKQVAPDDDEAFLRWLDRKSKSSPPQTPPTPGPGLQETGNAEPGAAAEDANSDEPGNTTGDESGEDLPPPQPA